MLDKRRQSSNKLSPQTLIATGPIIGVTPSVVTRVSLDKVKGDPMLLDKLARVKSGLLKLPENTLGIESVEDESLENGVRQLLVAAQLGDPDIYLVAEEVGSTEIWARFGLGLWMGEVIFVVSPGDDARPNAGDRRGGAIMVAPGLRVLSGRSSK